MHSTLIHTHTHCVVALIENLREYFDQFGNIADCTVMYNSENKHRLVMLMCVCDANVCVGALGL